MATFQWKPTVSTKGWAEVIDSILHGVCPRSGNRPMPCGTGTGILISWSPGWRFPRRAMGQLHGMIFSSRSCHTCFVLISHSAYRISTEFSGWETVFIILCWLTQKARATDKVALHLHSLLDFKGLWSNPARPASSMDLPISPSLYHLDSSDLGTKTGILTLIPSCLIFWLWGKPFHFPEPQFSHLK